MNHHYTPQDLEPACFYLRKSREDQEAESRGEGETLTKHKKALLKLTKEYGTTITKIFEEIVSGESLIHRPEMLNVLKEVEDGKWKSVWCMDIDRLGRGNMQEQGLIIEMFKKSHTKIVTPRKIYDLNDEFDEEYTEFEAFMARKELKIITRRLQNGRLRSIEDGNYLGTSPPYGYLIKTSNGKRFLVKHPEQREAAALIWKLYLESYGTNKIANELNGLGFLSYTGKKWAASSVLSMLKNPVYAGITTWKKKEQKKSTTPGVGTMVRSRPRAEQLWVYDTHEAYVTIEEFQKVQDMLATKYHPPYQLIHSIANPLAGMIKCDLCGSSMVYRTYTHQQFPHLICPRKLCPNKSSRFEFVEEELIDGLKKWLNQYKAQWDIYPLPDDKDTMLIVKERVLQNLKKELKELNQQKDRLHDFLEKKIYDSQTYLERFKTLAERIEKTAMKINETEYILSHQFPSKKVQQKIIPKIKEILTIYSALTDPAIKNNMLKTILKYATYRKEKYQQGNNFTLVLYPRLPQYKENLTSVKPQHRPKS
ncbi:recombinase family protein [Pelosinus sp. sgz500959]|uniref:recombinase family protein n=1 Tax=Pelosinus sp. sgz500959 TaxID=3242472 RepID=UPI00367163CD